MNLKIMAIGLSLPSGILVIAWGIRELAKRDIISIEVGFMFLVGFIVISFISMVLHVKKN